MRRGDFHRPGAELHVYDDRVGHDGQAAVQEGVDNKLAMEVLQDQRSLTDGRVGKETRHEPCIAHRRGARQLQYPPTWSLAGLSPRQSSHLQMRSVREGESNDQRQLTGALDRIRKAGDNAKLEFLLCFVPRHAEEGPSRELFLVHLFCPHDEMRHGEGEVERCYLEIGERGVQLDTPIDESVGAVDNPVLVKLAKGLDYSL